jgi:predicted KAP-like P-loop ATPase
LKFITDDFDFSEPVKFHDYSDSLSQLIKKSDPKFSIGIFGAWGTGKTTLMKMIEKKLEQFVSEQIFTWEVIEDEKEQARLVSFLKDNYGIDWISNASFEKINHDTLIIKDKNVERIMISKGSYEDKSLNTIEIKLDGSKAYFLLNGNEIREFRIETSEDKKKRIHMIEKEILTVWFNAWRYEREEQFALIALMKTIAYAMIEFPVYHDVKKIFLRGLGIVTKDIIRNLLTKYVVTEKGLEELEKKLLPKMELLSEVDKNTIYFDGLNKIEEEMKKLSGKHRIVVFIDDLDRCNSKKALEVFESTKIFLDLEGFVFVIGLNYDTLSKLIKEEYKQIGIKGEEYIKKLVQIPVNLPRWNSKDISLLIDKISSKLDESIIDMSDDESKELLNLSVASNPRETKRLLNHLMLIKSINPSMELKEFLVNHLLESQWLDLYQNLDIDKGFRSVFVSVLELKHTTNLSKYLEQYGNRADLSSYEKKLFEIPLDIWSIIWKYKTIFLKIINEWELQKEFYSMVSIPRFEPIEIKIHKSILEALSKVHPEPTQFDIGQFITNIEKIFDEAEKTAQEDEVDIVRRFRNSLLSSLNDISGSEFNQLRESIQNYSEEDVIKIMRNKEITHFFEFPNRNSKMAK